MNGSYLIIIRPYYDFYLITKAPRVAGLELAVMSRICRTRDEKECPDTGECPGVRVRDQQWALCDRLCAQ